MRIIDWKVLKTKVPYSRQHIKRLEDDGKFPLRVTLGACRIGWVETEVDAWIKQRMDQRGPVSTSQ